MKNFDKNWYIVLAVAALMLVYFFLAHPALNDDGFQYEGFAESAAHGHIDFKNFYGFQGLSFLAVPVFWLTHSKISVILTSSILFLFSLPLAYLIGRDYYGLSEELSRRDFTKSAGGSKPVQRRHRDAKKAGLMFLALILLTPYPYTTMMRGFQEAALLFFILLIIYGSLKQKKWTPLAWAYGGIVKPFALVLLPLFAKNFIVFRNVSYDTFLNKRKTVWLLTAVALGIIYLGTSYYQTGHLINNAAINSYQGNFNTGNPPPLEKSFVFGIKGFGRVLANLLVYSRKILISPLVILLGLGLLLKNKILPLRKALIFSIILNFVLVGSLTFSFQKYLLPMVVLLALVSAPLLVESWFLKLLVLADSVLVFKPIYDYFGHDFWNSFKLFLIPLYLVMIIFLTADKIKRDATESL